MSKPRATRKIPDCDRCLLYANEPFLICAVHPFGPEGDNCLDFRPNPDLENRRFEDFLGLELRAGAEMADYEMPIDNPFDLDPEEEPWQPEGARFVNGELVIERDRSFYNGEEIIQPRQRWTREEQLARLDWHPLFTGKCPQCGAAMERDYTARVHWDCDQCAWMDDSV